MDLQILRNIAIPGLSYDRFHWNFAHPKACSFHGQEVSMERFMCVLYVATVDNTQMPKNKDCRNLVGSFNGARLEGTFIVRDKFFCYGGMYERERDL